MKKFSLEKYIAWCKSNKEPIYPWAFECDGKEVKRNLCEEYIIHKDWTIRE